MSVADILSQLAANAGRAQLTRGALIGGAVADAAQVPAQILADREKRALLLRQQAAEDEKLRFARNADTRAQADQGLQDAAATRELQKASALRAGIAAGFGESGDPTKFNVAAAQKAVTEAGFPELATTLADVHSKLLPKLTPATPGSAVRDETGHVVPGSEIPDKKPDYTINGQRFSGATNQPIGTVQPTQTTKSIESKNVLLDGKPAIVNFNPATGVHTLPSGEDVSARVAPIPAAAVQINTANKAGAPGDFTKTGEEFLATIPLQWRATVRKIAHYDEDPTKVASMRGGNREMLSQWVNQVNPAYDAGLFTNRAPTRKAFTTGPQGREITAMNTAIGHLDQLTGLVDKLGNGSFTPGNKVWNDVATIFGSDKVTNFDTLKDVLASEIAKTLSGGVATVDGIKEQRAKMNGYSSPDQLAGYVKTVIPTMGSKLAAHNFTYHQAMGENDSWSALSPASKHILTKFGFDPEHPEISTSSREIPANVRDALKGIAPGRHTLSDGSIWLVGADGSVTKGS